MKSSGMDEVLRTSAGVLVGAVVTLVAFEFRSYPGLVRLGLLVTLSALAAAYFLASVRIGSKRGEGAHREEESRHRSAPSSRTEQPESPSRPAGPLPSPAAREGASRPGAQQPASSVLSASSPKRTSSPRQEESARRGPRASSEQFSDPPTGSIPGARESGEHRAKGQPDGSSAGAGAGRGPRLLLPAVWERYLEEGDGWFNAAGLEAQLRAAGIPAEVLSGSSLGLDKRVLAVDLRDGAGELYLLPSFRHPPRAVSDWFQSSTGGNRQAMIERVVEVARVRRSGTGIELLQPGRVE